MKTKVALRFYGSKQRTAAAAQVTRQAVDSWKDYPPRDCQVRLEKHSKGILQAELEVIAYYHELLDGFNH